MSWLTEFDKSYACPSVPTGFSDTSWHNDTCPSYMVTSKNSLLAEGVEVRVWMEHPNPDLRENGPEEGIEHRFLVTMWDSNTGYDIKSANVETYENAVSLARYFAGIQ